MLHECVRQVSLFGLLHRIDQDLAQGKRLEGCPHCGGLLHYSNYDRKPRGGPDEIPEQYCKRLSLCCGRQGCRRRALPPSCLFMGRRVYWGVVILVVVTLRQQRTEGFSANKVKKLFGISRKTLVRWMTFYHEEFPATPWWQRLRGRLSAKVSSRELPASLVVHFIEAHDDLETALVACQFFLAVGRASPYGAASMRAGSVHAKDGGFPAAER